MKDNRRDIQRHDYTDVILNSHSQYLNILNLIRKNTERVTIVQIDGRDDGDVIVSTAKELMPLEKTEIVDSWFGTKAPGRAAVQYTFLKKRAFFDYLCSLESFFIVTSTNPYRVKRTDFGLDDIAFLDGSGHLLFYTVTHEGYACLSNRYSAAYGK
ncbi:MAG: hypothetical protein IKH21_02300 [Clostridia bacterium]|nr:hypothetical protein [Clostridia bacterium]